MKNLVLVLLMMACVMPVSAQNEVLIDSSVKWSSYSLEVAHFIEAEVGSYHVIYNLTPSKTDDGFHDAKLTMSNKDVVLTALSKRETVYIRFSDGEVQLSYKWYKAQYSAQVVDKPRELNEKQQQVLSSMMGFMALYGDQPKAVFKLKEKLAKLDLSALNNWSPFSYSEVSKKPRKKYETYSAHGDFHGWKYTFSYKENLFMLKLIIESQHMLATSVQKKEAYPKRGGHYDIVPPALTDSWAEYQFSQSINEAGVSEASKEIFRTLFAAFISRVQCSTTEEEAAAKIKSVLTELKAELTANN